MGRIKKELTVKLFFIEVAGEAVINLWGGGQGSIKMKPTRLIPEKATKDNILRCVNDNGFGCKSIDSAEIYIYARYHHGAELYVGSINVSHPIHQKLFSGWMELENQKAIFK